MSDVIIVGGGPAGASLAVMLGRSGLNVELFEVGRFPRDKPCGEGLLPPGVDVLERMGLLESVAGARVGGVQYHVGPHSLRAPFATDGNGDGKGSLHGIGQRRLVLDSALWNAAAATPGVRAHQGARVSGAWVDRGRVRGVMVDGQIRRATLVVAADGSCSSVRRNLGLEHTPSPHRLGIRAHFRRSRGAVPLDDVQIFVRSGYELYVTPLPGDEILVAALAHHDAAGVNVRRAFDRWILAEPLLRGWLDGATQTSELAGRSPLTRGSRAVSHPGLVLIGDAAASVDPITAGGMSLALVSAELLARQIPEMLRGSRLAARHFERARAATVRVHRWLGACLLALGRHPAAAERACRWIQGCPTSLRALVDLVARSPAELR